jgi:hypothetical protein
LREIANIHIGEAGAAHIGTNLLKTDGFLQFRAIPVVLRISD